MGNTQPVANGINIQWNQINIEGYKPPAREAHCSGVIGPNLYVFGGGTSGQGIRHTPVQYNDLHVFNSDKSSWEELPKTDHTPQPRTGACMGVVGLSLYIFGGLIESDWTNDLHVFNTESKAWTLVSTNGTPPSRRDKTTCCAVGSKIYYFGGFGPREGLMEADNILPDEDEIDEPPSATFTWFNDLHMLDTETMTWTKITTSATPPTPRAAHAMAVVENQLYIFGGRDPESRRDDLHSLNLDTLTWKANIQTIGFNPAARSFHTMISVDSRLIIFGGLSKENVNFSDIHILDTPTLIWLQPKIIQDKPETETDIQSAAVPARGFHSSNLVGTKCVVFGGSSAVSVESGEAATYFNDLWWFDVGTVTNEPTPKIPEDVTKASEPTTVIITKLSEAEEGDENLPKETFEFKI